MPSEEQIELYVHSTLGFLEVEGYWSTWTAFIFTTALLFIAYTYTYCIYISIIAGVNVITLQIKG